MDAYASAITDLEALARDRGLTFDQVLFATSDADSLAQVASMGLPNRFLHWYWGGAYKELSTQQTKELFSILELVLNTRPSYAFLRSSNSYLQNVMVIAHVLGHADFFHNNHWYQKSNKNMLNEAELHARTIRRYEVQFGRERVEQLLDALLTVAGSVNAFERSPQERQKRLMYYLAEHAPLEPFEQHLLEMVRAEAEYFDLIQRTHIINEGWATYVEATLLREALGPREWAEISVQFCNRPAPYVIGYTLFTGLERSAGYDHVLEARRYYEDIMLVQEALTQEMVERLDLFVFDAKEQQRRYELDLVQEMLISQKLHKGEPHIEVEPGSHSRELVLVHRDEGRKLDAKRVGLFLKALHTLWRNSIRLRANGKTYTFDRRGLSST